MQILPALTLLVAALIAVLPFGTSEGVRACLSFAPVIITHYWCVRRPHLMPVVVVFAVGLAIDILTHGPVGFWALMMLGAAALAQLEAAVTGQSTSAGRAAVFAITMFSVAGLSWAVASAYNGQLIEGRPMLLAALIAILIYPVVAVLLIPIDRLWETQRSHLFEREA
jgi:rod shape-determining protein MreD